MNSSNKISNPDGKFHAVGEEKNHDFPRVKNPKINYSVFKRFPNFFSPFFTTGEKIDNFLKLGSIEKNLISLWEKIQDSIILINDRSKTAGKALQIINHAISLRILTLQAAESQYQRAYDELETELQEAGSKVHEYIAKEANIPELLDMLYYQYKQNNSNSNVLYYLAKNPNTPQEIQQKLLQLNDKKINQSLGMNPSISSESMNILFNKNDPEIHLALAGNPSTTKEILELLIEQYSNTEDSSLESDIHETALLSRNNSPGTLNRLMRSYLDELGDHDSDEEKRKIARNICLLVLNSKTPPEAIAHLYYHNNLKLMDSWSQDHIFSHLSHHSNTPANVLENMRTEKVPKYIGAILGNRNFINGIPYGELQNIAKYSDVQNLADLADNPDIYKFPEIMDILTEKDDFFVNMAIAMNPNFSRNLININDEDACLALAIQTSTPAETLESIYNLHKTNPKIVEFLIKNPNTPVHIIEELAKTDSSKILDEILQKPGIFECQNLLEILLKNPNIEKKEITYAYIEYIYDFYNKLSKAFK